MKPIDQTVLYSEIADRDAATSLFNQVKQRRLDIRSAFKSATVEQQGHLLRLSCTLVDPIHGHPSESSMRAWRSMTDALAPIAGETALADVERSAQWINSLFSDIDKQRQVTFPISLESIAYRWDHVMREAQTVLKKRGRGVKHQAPSRALQLILGYFPANNQTMALHASRSIGRAEEQFSDVAKFIYHANGKSYRGAPCTHHDFETLLSSYREWGVVNKIFKDWMYGNVRIRDGQLEYDYPQITFMSHISLERDAQDRTGLRRACNKIESARPYPITIPGTSYAARNSRELYSLLDAAHKFICNDLSLRIDGHELGQWMALFFDFRVVLLKRYATQSHAATSCARVSKSHLMAALVDAGHDEHHIARFIALVQFDPLKSRDLFDGLLIDDKNDPEDMLFIRSYIDNVDVVPALASIFNHDSIDTSRRGIFFEEEVKKRLLKCGITAQRLHRNDRACGEFELDLSFCLDGNYYFIQCKSTSPVYTMSPEKFFAHIVDFRNQARRVSDYFKSRIGLIPELMTSKPARYHKTIIVVSFQAPFVISFPDDDLVLTDWTTLDRFLKRDCPQVVIGDNRYPDKHILPYFTGPVTSEKLDAYLALHYPLMRTWQLAELEMTDVTIGERTIMPLGISTIGGLPFSLQDISPEFVHTHLHSMGYTQDDIDAIFQKKSSVTQDTDGQRTGVSRRSLTDHG